MYKYIVIYIYKYITIYILLYVYYILYIHMIPSGIAAWDPPCLGLALSFSFCLRRPGDSMAMPIG